jgi:hypothetical protein
MPTFQNPAVSDATVALKNEQRKLTALKRRLLEGDFIPIKVMEEFCLFLAADFRGELLSLPGLVRREVHNMDFKNANAWAVEDAVERAVDKWMLAYSSRELPALPKNLRTSTYTTRPGPKPRAKKVAPASA